MDWIGLAQDRDRWWTLVSAVMNLRVLWNAGNFLISCKPDSCSGRTLHRGVSKYTVQFYSLVPCDSTLQHVCIARLRKREESVIIRWMASRTQSKSFGTIFLFDSKKVLFY
jgi:hypothetical protein